MTPILLALLLAAPAAPQAPTPSDPVATAIARAAPGTRIGLMVVDETGREIVAVRPDERFVPASNTKIFTTAAAFATLDMTAPDGGGGAEVRLEGRDVVLSGHGDARLSSAADCRSDCLADLARAVAARTRIVHDVIGDDSALPDERWPQGMSWNNQVGRYGTAISALTIDDNVVALSVTPGAAGAPPAITGDGYYELENRATTVAGGKTALEETRQPGSHVLRIGGTIAAGAPARTVLVGIDDPAHRAAWRLAQILRAEGVRVTGTVSVRHRPPSPSDDPDQRGGAPAPHAPAPPAALARLAPPPLGEDVRHTNKVSQNLHAELLLRRVGATTGSGSVADGRAVVVRMLGGIGIPRWQYEFADGSGMSSYNRVTPRATVTLLRWIAAQPWGAAWRATLPVGGVDGTLASRFHATPLDGRLFAKTGSLNATSAVSGYLTAASGHVLTFAAFANDVPGDASATAAIDQALLAVAASH
ncbi:D-alanyl-D-alanine carboxypeptidase/D-alanyl-D-alanine-endopeptidase [Sphingomonas sp. GC_Shp_3]|uniref:D-alanyl-D-alanine carboxypeptidase/D-alanyl-D-alanine endopeptidase n=1 Tax=Sphingomonas sp. GC_Shp_3 TaxID=2937383 RepID=UPI00226AE191|nr:D-alanyl-D-alanine carboxypeptidase/D-alanyl-D-alanine-endopeptidase [Sphingomonas sp. GC_Shp_3]